MRDFLQRFEITTIIFTVLAMATALMAMPIAARADGVDTGAYPYADLPPGAYVDPGLVRPSAPRWSTAPLPDTGGGPYIDGRSGAARPPRWSNDHQIDNANAGFPPDCLYGPDYVPGVDVAGRPVTPADVPSNSLPYGVEAQITLGGRRRGFGGRGRGTDLTIGDVYYDPATKEISVNGVPLVRDCIQPTK